LSVARRAPMSGSMSRQSLRPTPAELRRRRRARRAERRRVLALTDLFTRLAARA